MRATTSIGIGGCVTAALLSAFVFVTRADAQIDVLRRARDAARETPSVASLFGKEPAITTTIDDARDGVAALDGFEPKAYSPMAEMPRGPGGAYLLVPGTYVLVTQSFCLKPGTYGPRTGAGYLHAEWHGDKAPLVSALIARSVDHPEVEQRQVQLLLWAIVMRADMNQLYPETKQAALRLLTPAELLDLAGYKLGTVPDALRNRVLQSVPETVRSVLEAENEMRKMLASAETKYADVERIAVREGALPASEAAMAFPAGRWSYHPSGFFIRYAPRSYSFMRVDIYYPDKFEIHRDGSGRITSVTKADGREVRPDHSPFQLIDDATARKSALRLAAMKSLARGEAADARGTLLTLARADVEDLRALEATIAKRRTDVGRADTLAVREALHAALARFIGLAHLEAIPRGSLLEQSLRPIREARGYRYPVVPVAQNIALGATRTLGTRGWNPSHGGATPPGSLQRLGPSGNPMNLPSYTPPQNTGSSDNEPPAEPDALDKAEKAIGAFNNASDLFGGLTDPAGFIGGQPQGQMLGAGFDAAFKTARGISNGMQGKDSGDEEAEQAPEYQTFARPRTIELPALQAAALPAQHAAAVKDAISTVFRMAMVLEAVAATRARFAEAHEAHDETWVNAQGHALIHLRRLAGVEMVKLSRALGAIQRFAGTRPAATENEVRDAQRALAANGWSAERRAIARQVGISDAELETQRQRVLALDPRTTALGAASTIQELRTALYRYGSYLALLPEVPAPWQ